MSAREQFKEGDRVRLSERGLATFKVGPRAAQTGTVVGFGRATHSYLLYVQRDGQKAASAAAWHMLFWAPCVVTGTPDD